MNRKTTIVIVVAIAVGVAVGWLIGDMQANGVSKDPAVNVSMKGNEKFLTSGTAIEFEGATIDDPGIVTVLEGVMEVTFFDGSHATVGMGKFPVLSATVIQDSWVFINDKQHKVSFAGNSGDDDGVVRSGTWHTHWMDWSKWN